MTRPLLTLALAAVLVTAGCVGAGDRTPAPIEGSASAATVSEEGRSAAGYEEVAVESDRVTRSGTIDVSGDVELSVDYRANATARRAVYRARDADPPSVFAVYSVPLLSPERVDVTVDPLGDRSTAEVVARSQGTYDGFGDFEHVENASVTVLGTETTLVNYATTANAGGTTVDVDVYLTVVEHEGDLVRTVAVVPRADDDPGTVRTLLESVQH